MESSASSQAPAKRPKIAESLDPFETLRPTVHELIFQHLRSEEVLQASMVSRSFFAASEASEKCGEKLWLYMKGTMRSSPRPSLKKPGKKLKKALSQFKSQSSNCMKLVVSSRKYQNIKLIQYLDGGMDEGVLMFLKSRKWKQIEMCDIKFEAKKDLFNFFKTIQVNAETIKCNRVFVGFSVEITDDDVAELRFPMLKELNITSSSLLENFFIGCTSLAKLHFSSEDWSRDSALEKFLGNSNLEASLDIKLWSLYDSQAFFEAITRHQFKLKSLVFRTHNIDEARLNVFLKLLEIQAGNIEQLDLGIIRSLRYDDIETILKMPNLKTLGIGFNKLETRDWDIVQLTSNSSIEKLEINNDAVDWTMFLIKFLRSALNLKSFRIPYLDDKILETLGPLFTTYITKIEELSVGSLKLVNSWFSNVHVKSKGSNIRHAIKKEILAKSPEHRSPLEKLIIAENE